MMFVWHDTTWMWLSMLAFWSLFALVFFYAARDRSGQAPPRARGPADLLDERYARGEISNEEYRGRRHALEQIAVAGSPR